MITRGHDPHQQPHDVDGGDRSVERRAAGPRRTASLRDGPTKPRGTRRGTPGAMIAVATSLPPKAIACASARPDVDDRHPRRSSCARGPRRRRARRCDAIAIVSPCLDAEALVDDRLARAAAAPRRDPTRGSPRPPDACPITLTVSTSPSGRRRLVGELGDRLAPRDAGHALQRRATLRRQRGLGGERARHPVGQRPTRRRPARATVSRASLPEARAEAGQQQRQREHQRRAHHRDAELAAAELQVAERDRPHASGDPSLRQGADTVVAYACRT